MKKIDPEIIGVIIVSILGIAVFTSCILPLFIWFAKIAWRWALM